MIPRYTPKIIADLWSDDARWQRVLDVELTVADVLAADGVIPTKAAAAMRRRARFDLAKIAQYEAVSRHDLIAFLQSVGDSLGDLKRWLHLGLTSYDVIDTALGMALGKAGELIQEQLKQLRKSLATQAWKHRQTLMAGRTHGVHAEPTTFGWKICGWIAELDRNAERLQRAISSVKVGKLSGAVGTYPYITPDQEARVCERLGLTADPVATQVIARDRHAEFVCTLAIIGGLVERIALEVRLLQHSEVEELSEPFGKGQRGSSAMPHKKNPVTAENLCGLARMLRAYSAAALEDMALWHERDISHSSVERVIFPDATALTYYLLEKVSWTVDNWTVDVARMRAHVAEDRGLMASGAVLTALKMAGIEDEDIYRRIQAHSLAARAGGATLKERVKKDRAIVAAVGNRLDELFDDEAVLKRADIPFKRLGIGE
jgi:adenylosuccinate lyase